MQRSSSSEKASDSPSMPPTAPLSAPPPVSGPSAATVPVAPAALPPNTWLQELLQTPPLQQFVRFGLQTTTLDEEAIGRLERVLAVMTARGCVQEALWYLEHCDWDVGQAVALYHQDEADRILVDSFRHLGINERANAITPANFHPGYLTFQATHRIGQSNHAVNFRFPLANGFNHHDPRQLRQLNQWGGDLVRWYLGPPPASPVPRSPYTIFERRFIRNRFGSRDYANGETPGFPQIVREFNAIFQARYLPGSRVPCGPRMQGSLTNLVDLTWRTDQIPGRRTNDSNRSAANAIAQTRLEEQQRYDALVATSTNSNNTASALPFASPLFVPQDPTAPGAADNPDDLPDFREISDLALWEETGADERGPAGAAGAGDSGQEQSSEEQPSRKRQRRE